MAAMSTARPEPSAQDPIWAAFRDSSTRVRVDGSDTGLPVDLPALTTPPDLEAAGANGKDVATTAKLLVTQGFWIVPLHPSEKRPIGFEWGVKRKDIGEINRLLAEFKGAGIGLCLGPGRGPGGTWLADFEIDGAKGEESLTKLLGGEVVTTMSWSSRRGLHRVFTVDGKRLVKLLTACKAVEGRGPGKVGCYHLDALPGLEIRLGGCKPDGTVKQVQSVLPPTVTDGIAQTWIRGPNTHD
jgi:hypothetical protein